MFINMFVNMSLGDRCDVQYRKLKIHVHEMKEFTFPCPFASNRNGVLNCPAITRGHFSTVTARPANFISPLIFWNTLNYHIGLRASNFHMPRWRHITDILGLVNTDTSVFDFRNNTPQKINKVLFIQGWVSRLPMMGMMQKISHLQ